MKNNWVLLAIGSAIFGALFTLSAKFATTSFEGLTYVFYIFSIQGILMWFVLAMRRTTIFSPNGFLLSSCAGLFSVLGNLCEYQAIKDAPNVGYAKSIISGQIVLVAIASKFLFKDQNLSIKCFLGIVSVAVGIFFVGSSQQQDVTLITNNWILWSFASLTAFSLMILVVKKVSINLSPDVVLFNVLFSGGIIAWITNTFAGGNLNFEIAHIPIILALSVFGTMTNIFLFRSIAVAPNAGYPSAINTGQIIIVSLCSIFLFQAQILSMIGVVGIVLVVLGIGLIVIG